MADQRREPDQRPSPDALLEAARRKRAALGKLKIFMGAAPGVGKTYEMLQQARARQKDGYDIVVGVVETHGRKETEALFEGLEVVPRQRFEYKGQWLEEMDLDAILARRPQTRSRRRARAHQCRGQPPPQTLSRRRRAAEQRHRRLHHASTFSTSKA